MGMGRVWEAIVQRGEDAAGWRKVTLQLGRAPAAMARFSLKLPRDSKLQPHLCFNVKCMRGRSSAGRFGGEKIRGIL